LALHVLRYQLYALTFHRGESPWRPLNNQLGGPRKHSRRITEKNNTLPLNNRTTIPRSLSPSLVATQNVLSGQRGWLKYQINFKWSRAIWNPNIFLTDVNSGLFNITAQPVRAAGHSTYLMPRLRMSGAVPPVLGMPLL